MFKIQSVQVYPEKVQMKIGDWYYGLQAECYPKIVSCDDIFWSSSNPKVVSVENKNGYLYACAEGEAFVYANAKDGSGVKASCHVTVLPFLPVSTVKLSSCGLEVEKDGTAYLMAIVMPENASRRDLIWSCNSPGYLEFKEISGGALPVIQIIGKKAGTVVLTATAADGSGVCASCVVTVLSKNLLETKCVLPTEYVLMEGEFQTLCSKELERVIMNSKICWKSNNPSVALVNEKTGHIYGCREGKTVISAKLEGGSDKEYVCEVTVKPMIPVSGIHVFPFYREVEVGECITLNVKLFPSNASNTDVFWLSDNEDVAKINPKTGKIEAISPGKATIRAYAKYPNLYGECQIMVMDDVSCGEDDYWEEGEELEEQ